MTQDLAAPRLEPTRSAPAPLRVLFVNSGILGMASFSKYIREAMAVDPEIEASHINLSEQLTPRERIVRWLLCARAWPDGILGLANVDLGRFRCEYHAGLLAMHRIRAHLSRSSVDVVHFHRQPTAWAALGLMRQVPSIVSIDSTQDVMLDVAASPFERWSYLPNALMDGRVFQAAAAIVSTSEWAAGCLRRRYRDCRTPLYVMPPPVRLQVLDERWVEERYARAAKPGYSPRVLFVGGDFIRKGGTDLLAAWRLGELHRVATLELASDWPLPEPDMPGVRVVRGVESYSSEWSQLWRAADIFVLPTRHEAYGTVFREAAAAGLPRIGTRINAIPETIADGENGLLVEPGDRRALIEALRTLIDSPDLRRRFGQAARASIAGTGSPDAYRSGLRAIVQSVARREAAA